MVYLKGEEEKNQSLDMLQPWVVGAVNIDEDIHFSSYYLKQSMESFLPSEFKGLGYKNIVAIYEDFNETYYIPLKECEEVSDNLIQKSLDDPLFMDDIINLQTYDNPIINQVFEKVYTSIYTPAYTVREDAVRAIEYTYSN